MKKIVFVTVILIGMIGCSCSFSQIIPTYPIPSFKVKVNGSANFRENYIQRVANPTKEKRSVHIVVGSASGCQNCSATIWVYSLDHTTILGPYTIACGQSLTIPIDEREWGVLVESDEDVIVDVWIDAPSLLKPQGHLLQPIYKPNFIISELETWNLSDEM